MPKYAPFMRDLQEVSAGVIVNSPGWEQKLADNQQQFAQKWVRRPEFKAAYDGMSNAGYVSALYANAGILPPQAKRDSLVSALDASAESRAKSHCSVVGSARFDKLAEACSRIVLRPAMVMRVLRILYLLSYFTLAVNTSSIKKGRRQPLAASS